MTQYKIKRIHPTDPYREITVYGTPIADTVQPIEVWEGLIWQDTSKEDKPIYIYINGEWAITGGGSSSSDAPIIQGTFINADLVNSILTVNHLYGELALPYVILDNDNKVIIPDDVTFGDGTIILDLTTQGTLTGTWSYQFGSLGAPGNDGVTPNIGENGNWFIGATDTNIPATGEDGTDGITPSIGVNNHWFIGETDTGIVAQGVDGHTPEKGVDYFDGTDGVTPHIGVNGNWYLGEIDTGVPATGEDGITPNVGVNGNWYLGETDTGVKAIGVDGYTPQKGVDYNDGYTPQKGVDYDDGVTPTIGGNGNWFIGAIDTGIKAAGTNAPQVNIRYSLNGTSFHAPYQAGDIYMQVSVDGSVTFTGAMRFRGEDGTDGTDGLTPSVGVNGNWYLGAVDSGVPATGPQGQNAPLVKAQYSVNTSEWHDTYDIADCYIHFSYDNGSTYGSAVYFKGSQGNPGTAAPAVVAQYSVDGSSWHDTYTSADVYIHFSYNGGSSYGSTIRIKGEITFGSTAGTAAEGDKVIMKALVDAKGDLIVATGADAVARLPIGITNGHALVVDSTQTAGMKWAAVGDAVGPASSTDNAIARYDSTTGKLLQDSLATIDDAGTITAPKVVGAVYG